MAGLQAIPHNDPLGKPAVTWGQRGNGQQASILLGKRREIVSTYQLGVEVGSLTTSETTVHLSAVQITVLRRLFADAISSWVRNAM